MHYTILACFYPYICFGTFSAIFRGCRREFIVFDASNSLTPHVIIVIIKDAKIV
jgi:hypothetical protein